MFYTSGFNGSGRCFSVASQNAWRSLADGAPVEVSLALAFEETELVTGEDVIGETKIGRFKGSGGKF